MTTIDANAASKSNPLGRLIDVLNSVRHGNPKTRMLEAWAEVLHVTNRPDFEVPRRLVMLDEMLDETERTVRMIPGLNHKLFLSGFPNIRPVLSPINLQATRESVATAHLTPEVMARLDFCSDALNANWSEINLSAEELRSIEAELAELVQAVEQSQLSASLRNALLEALGSANIAISLYRAYGAKGLRKSMHGILGFALAEGAAIQREAEENSDVLARLVKWLDRIDSVTSKATNIYQAVNAPGRFLIGLLSKERHGKVVEEQPRDDDSLEA